MNSAIDAENKKLGEINLLYTNKCTKMDVVVVFSVSNYSSVSKQAKYLKEYWKDSVRSDQIHQRKHF